MWTAWVCSYKARQQTVVAQIAAGLIRLDPIIKTSLYHLSCDKKKSRNGRSETDRKTE